MKFLIKIKSWVWSPDFYKNLDGKPIWPAVKRLIAFVFIGSFIFSLWISLSAVPDVFKLGQEFEQYVNNEYPDDLVLNIENGIANTGNEKRYDFKMLTFLNYFNSKVAVNDIQKIGVNNVLVIDTFKKEWTFNEWQSADSMFLITKDSVISFDNKTFKVDLIPKTKDLIVIDHQKAIDWVSKLRGIIKILLPIGILFLFILVFAFNVVYFLLASLFSGFIIYLSSKINRRPVKDFRSSFEISLYAICLPALLLIIFPINIISFNNFILSVVSVLVIWILNNRINTKIKSLD